MAQDWKALVLYELNAPLSELNNDALQWWADSEGMPASDNNWLATTIGGFGGYPVNSVGVKAYPTVQAGAQATVATLQGGAYAGVVNAFRDGNSLVDIWQQVNASPWCRGCQNGLYPVVLFRNLGATPTTSPPPNSGPPPTRPPQDAKDQVSIAWGDLANAHRVTTTRWIGTLAAYSDRFRKARK